MSLGAKKPCTGDCIITRLSTSIEWDDGRTAVVKDGVRESPLLADCYTDTHAAGLATSRRASEYRSHRSRLWRTNRASLRIRQRTYRHRVCFAGSSNQIRLPHQKGRCIPDQHRADEHGRQGEMGMATTDLRLHRGARSSVQRRQGHMDVDWSGSMWGANRQSIWTFKSNAQCKTNTIEVCRILHTMESAQERVHPRNQFSHARS